MIPATCKRLIEVDFPIAAVSAHSAREKSIRRGHPSTLHLWWARRPLAACRAVLLGLLLPDPCEKDCPPNFKTTARELLAKRYGSVSKSDAELRELVLKFIGEFANWDHAANALYLEIGRGLVKAAHPEEGPVVVDPFAGGGSIPLEALRLGCEAFASDLNPVACLILKTLLEDIPRYGNAEFELKDDKGKDIMVRGLADALRNVGKQLKEAAEKELAEFYPPDPDGSRPVAYLWGRTVRCEAIGCGAEIPLLRGFWILRKANEKLALRYMVCRSKGQEPKLSLELFAPKHESDVQKGTVVRANATCPCCNIVLPAERVCAQLAAQRGGADALFDKKGRRVGGAMLFAVVLAQPGASKRTYRTPTTKDYEAVYAASKLVAQMPEGTLPNEPLPPTGTLGFRVQRYGMLKWGDLFTVRQKASLARLVKNVAESSKSAGARQALTELTALALSRFTDDYSSLCRWMDRGTPGPTFSRHALPILWDFCEICPFDDSSWRLGGSFEWVQAAAAQSPAEKPGQVQLASASQSPLGTDACSVWFTDPPYYDAIPYSDLSDFFFVWLKRCLPGHNVLADPFDSKNPLTPKTQEIVQDETRRTVAGVKDRNFFETQMAEAFAEGRRVMREDGIACVVFAHKTTEGWEALLSGMLKGGWSVSASWPISTERAGRPRAHDSAALSTSVHLVCRPRPTRSR
jgi:adenine-specific DNA methylase